MISFEASRVGGTTNELPKLSIEHSGCFQLSIVLKNTFIVKYFFPSSFLAPFLPSFLFFTVLGIEPKVLFS